MNLRWLSLAITLVTLASGCQCFPCFDHYANTVDDISDTHVYFDRLYNPKLDITRMGKPDWCSPVNNRMCPRCCNNGCYDRYDDCNLYPPLHPYEFPSNVMPPPIIRRERIRRQLDVDLMDQSVEPESPPPSPAKAPTPGSSYDK